MRYIVKVLHSGGHGPDAYVVLSTEKLTQAVDTAKAIERFGYTIGGECSAAVLRMEDGVVYPKLPADEGPDPDVLLFLVYRRHRDDPLMEEWINKDAERLYERWKKAA